MRIIVKITNEKAIPNLMKHGRFISRLSLINAVGMDVKQENINAIKKIRGVESVKITGIAKALR